MTRLQEFEAAVKKVSMDNIRANMPEPKMLHADMNWNLETLGYTWDMTSHMIASGLEKQLISSFEMVVCAKKDAMFLLTIGEKTQSGCFITGKYKNYWLKKQCS
jgi:predicted TIM-barrel enzyme